MEIHVLSEHKDLSNQELIKIYGPDVLNRRIPKRVIVSFIQPSLTVEGAQWYETVDIQKKMGIYNKGKIPKEFVYKLPGKRLKRKANKALDKAEKYSKMKWSRDSKAYKDLVKSNPSRFKGVLSCSSHVRSVEQKSQN